MAQINLLKQTGPEHGFWEYVPKILVRVFLVVLAALVIYYGWLIVKISKVQNQSLQVQAKISADQQQALNMPGRKELLVRQLQIKTLQDLISNHIYWSQFFKPLADVTLTASSYSSLRADATGDLVLNVQVPTLDDYDKYLQVFDQSQFNKNFSNLRVSSLSKMQKKNATAWQFNARMKFNPTLLNYNQPSGQ